MGEILGLIAGEGVRLLTLTGTGDIGKTRLAIEAAREVGNHYFLNGVAFVALAPLGDATLVVPTVSRALCLRDAGVHPLEVLCRHLGERKSLLVLDLSFVRGCLRSSS